MIPERLAVLSKAESMVVLVRYLFSSVAVDPESLFNEKTLVLYFLGTPTDDLGVLASELGQGREFNVLFNSVLEVAAPIASCGCGGGGCSAK